MMLMRSFLMVMVIRANFYFMLMMNMGRQLVQHEQAEHAEEKSSYYFGESTHLLQRNLKYPLNQMLSK
jgi:hypothetical protein